MKADPKTAAGRAFVRSLNILLKFARLYGHEHTRTIELLRVAWQELRSAIPMGTDGGLLLGATNSQLLLDGVPLEGFPAEKQFAQLLSAAGVASVQFFASVTEEEIGRFARAFPTGKAKPAELALQLKAALEGAQGIRINEICFAAAQSAAASLGADQEQFRQWLNDPQKLLELIAAAQGSNSGGVPGPGPGGPTPAEGASGAGGSGAAGHAGGGSGNGGGIGGGGTSTATGPGASFWTAGGGGSATISISGVAASGGIGSPGALGAGLGAGKGSGSGRGGHGEPSEEEIYGILSALTSFGHVGTGQGGVGGGGAFPEGMCPLP